MLDYERDLPVKPVGEWTMDSVTDWLHPAHGPLPHHLGEVAWENERFTVALWCLRKSIVTATELADRDRSDEELLKIQDARGWILHTALWHPTKKGFRHGHYEIELPKHYGNEGEWRLFTYRRICRAAATAASEALMSGPLRRIHHQLGQK